MNLLYHIERIGAGSIMSFNDFHLWLSKFISQLSNSLRKTYRRFRLRKSVKNFLTKPYKLSKEQKKQTKLYWKPYTKHFVTYWHELYYQKTGVFDARFVPDDIMFTEIEPYYNDYASSRGIDNKCNYDIIFPDVLKPKTVFRRMKGIFHDDSFFIISREDVIERCKRAQKVVLKIAVDVGYGVGVKLWDSNKSSIEELESMIDSFRGDIIGQELIVQHPELGRIHSKCVNCIRIITFITRKKVEYVCGYFRMGCGDSFVDFHGGCVCSINPDGSLMDTGFINDTCEPITHHPDSDICFSEYIIPNYERIKETAAQLHSRIGDFRWVSWDFSLSTDGSPILIEVNLVYGGIMYHQLGSGPIFADKSKEMLDEAYNKITH